MRGTFAEMNLVVGRRAYGIVAGLQPFESDQGEPPVRLKQICRVLRAPSGGLLIEATVLGQEPGGEQKTSENCNELPKVSLQRRHEQV